CPGFPGFQSRATSHTGLLRAAVEHMRIPPRRASTMQCAPLPATPVPARRPGVHEISFDQQPRTMPLLWTGVALAALLAASLLSLMPPAHAATAIQRCVAADGTPIYTDKPCAGLNAHRTPLS